MMFEEGGAFEGVSFFGVGGYDSFERWVVGFQGWLHAAVVVKPLVSQFAVAVAALSSSFCVFR